MLVDVRTYTVRPGTLKQHLAIYERSGFAVQKRHLGEPLAYLMTETGELNTYMHMWLYESAADRSTRRAAMEADPQWAAYRKESADAGFLLHQENRLMVPTSFCPITRTGI